MKLLSLATSCLIPLQDLLEDLSANGTNIRIIGIPKSPFCAVEITSFGGEPGKIKEFHHSHAPGPGVFMEEIIKELERRGVKFEIEDARPIKKLSKMLA